MSTSARRREQAPIRRDWLSKTLAGLLLGFGLALGCSGVLARLVSGLPIGTVGQLTMWLFGPVWMGALAGVYCFRSGRRAWAWLGAANLAVLGLWAAGRLV